MVFVKWFLNQVQVGSSQDNSYKTYLNQIAKLIHLQNIEIKLVWKASLCAVGTRLCFISSGSRVHFYKPTSLPLQILVNRNDINRTRKLVSYGIYGKYVTLILLIPFILWIPSIFFCPAVLDWKVFQSCFNRIRIVLL